MRLLILAAAAAAAIVLFLVLRPGDEDEEPPTATAPTTTTRAATVTTRTTAAPRRTRPRPPQTVTIRLRVQNGRPVGGIARPRVERGRLVRLVVRADVADHVHLHGYDLMRDLAPGAPAQLLFRASIAGRFEIELEERGLELAELEVRP